MVVRDFALGLALTRSGPRSVIQVSVSRSTDCMVVKCQLNNKSNNDNNNCIERRNSRF